MTGTSNALRTPVERGLEANNAEKMDFLRTLDEQDS